MRRGALLLSMLFAARARAEVIDIQTAPPPDPDKGNFWREMLYPHKDEIDAILLKVNTTIQNAEAGASNEYDPTGIERLRFYREALGPLRYIRKLAPDNVDILRLLGQVADEVGNTREAIDALEAAIDLVGAEKAGAPITGRLGIIYLRMGKTDDAIRYLRAAQGPVVGQQTLSGQVLVHLANALAARGQMSEAIDVLSNALPDNIQYYPNELALVSFSLAVLYDRDEQRGAAFAVLDHMQSAMQGQLGMMGAYALATMRFAPAADRHYYYGLLHEVAGNLSEARTEFALYAASGDMPFRRRALEHVAAIDELRRAGSEAANAHPPVRPYQRRPPRIMP